MNDPDDRYGDLLTDLALSAAPRTPPARLKERLLRSIHASHDDVQIWRRWRRDPTDADAGDRELIRAGEGEFEPTGVAGVSARRLAFDEAAGRVTMMVRMEPGARYPAHRHAAAEECYVLTGDLRHGDQVMNAGDFELAEAGSLHGEQWTDGGCLLLIHSSVNDELVAGS